MPLVALCSCKKGGGGGGSGPKAHTRPEKQPFAFAIIVPQEAEEQKDLKLEIFYKWYAGPQSDWRAG